jgi:hypothetical protein
MEDEFGLGTEFTEEPIVAKKPATKKAAPAEEIDPERDRDNWPVIYIEREKDRPNYEFLQVQGTYRDGSPLIHQLRVMRGVDVAVPPSIVRMLRDSIATHYEQRLDPMTNTITMERSDRSSVPWRLVSGGKYIR